MDNEVPGGPHGVLRIDTGIVTLEINGDPNNTLVFNPSEVGFAERYYALLGELEKRDAEFRARAEALDADAAKDDRGIPANMPDILAFQRELSEFTSKQIDTVFGYGTCEKVFGGVLSVTNGMYKQFFDGITPYMRTARAEKMDKYQSKPPPPEIKSKRKKHVTMK